MCFYNTLKNIKKKKHNFCYVGNRHDTYMYMVKIWCNARLGDCTFRSWSTNCSIIFSLVKCVVHNAVHEDLYQHRISLERQSLNIGDFYFQNSMMILLSNKSLSNTVISRCCRSCWNLKYPVGLLK